MWQLCYKWWSLSFNYFTAYMWGIHNNILNRVLSPSKFKWVFNVTGPPGALLLDRGQRSHWNNHYNYCFVQEAALGIYCTDFLPQLLAQVKYPMQFMVYENTYVTYLKQHFQRRYASTELQCIEWLALEIIKILWLWPGMTHVITSQ